eukprot:m.12464 g.12464  ORF g.12464 m.12464 type:complete len:249 (+) comp24090_c0_seq1:92-838(+)
MIAGQEVPATDATSPSATAGRADADDTQVAATEIAETAASPTSADIQPPPVASEQVLQLSPSRGDIPKLLNPAQVFQSPTQTNVSQQVIGATDENGRFFLFSTPGAGDQAQQQQQPTPMPMPMPMPQPVSADDMVGRTAVPSIIPGVQFAQAQTGKDGVLFLFLFFLVLMLRGVAFLMMVFFRRPVLSHGAGLFAAGNSRNDGDGEWRCCASTQGYCAKGRRNWKCICYNESAKCVKEYERRQEKVNA